MSEPGVLDAVASADQAEAHRAPHPGLIVDPRFRVQVLAGEGVLVVSEMARTLFRGELYERLVPMLDGRYDRQALAAELGRSFGPAKVYYALARLTKAGAVMTALSGVPPARLAFWRELGVEADVAESRLATTAVEIIDLTGETATVDGYVSSAELVLAALNRTGIQSSPETTNGAIDLRLVLVADYLQRDLEEVNAAALRSRSPWLLVKPLGRELWVGPLFRPGVTGCWECLAQRLKGNRDVAGYLVASGAWSAPVSVATMHLPATRALAADLAVWTLLKAIATDTTTTDREATDSEQPDGSTLQTLDTVTGKLERHAVLRRPQCPACGDPAPRPSGPVVLGPSPVREATDGGYRSGPAEEVVARYERHVSRITGAVPILARLPAGDADLLRVYIAGQNLAMPVRDLNRLRYSLRSASAGKGISDAQAKASALAEALERYSGRRRGTEVTVRGSYRSLGADALHPNACQLYSEAQYAAAADWNARGSLFATVPARFDEDAEVDWTPVWSLTSQSARLLPTGYCYFDEPDALGAAFYQGDSNGCAAGATLTEAVLQGFLELVERDAVALWWYHRLVRPGVDLDSFDEPYLRRLPEQYARLDRDVWALDLTHDLGIPTFVAVSRRPGRDPEQVLFGFGAHLDARLALLRAVTELNQMVSRGPVVDALEPFDQVESDWLRTAAVADLAYLRPDPAAARRQRADFGVQSPPDDLLESVDHCRQLVEARGMEMLVLDHSRPDIGLPVAKVFVPGLRHFWARFAPGRLYDVPVQLGWLSEPTPESALNPVPMFL